MERSALKWHFDCFDERFQGASRAFFPFESGTGIGDLHEAPI